MVVTHQARLELLESARWWAEHRSESQADRWLSGFEVSLSRLADNAEKLPLAPEAGAFDFPLHQLSYGLRGRPTHRAVLRISGDRVEVLAVRHLARQELSPEDL